jgi:hypothetical protein
VKEREVMERSPGPWVYTEKAAQVRDANGVAIAEPLLPVSISEKTMDANGRQMAAAPELVEALREMLREYPDCGCTGDAPGSRGQVCGACKALAALKKAGAKP